MTGIERSTVTSTERSIMTENRMMIIIKEQIKAGGHNCRNQLSCFATHRFRPGVLPAMLSAFLWILLLLSLPAVHVCAEEGYDEVAGVRDGEYIVGTECSSSFFHIEEARLTVKDGKMTALLTMSSSSYLLVYPGTAEEAAAAPYEDYIPSVEIDTWDTFTIPVEMVSQKDSLSCIRHSGRLLAL